MAKKKNRSIEFQQIKLFDLEEEKIAFPAICSFIKDTDEGQGFPAICRFIRETFGVTQERMALKLKTSPNGYTHWEYAKRVPKGFFAFNLRQLYDQAKEISTKQLSPKEASYKFQQIKLFDPKEGNLEFPAICRFIRQTFAVTQEEMGLKLGINPISYGHWEYAKRVPKGFPAFNLRQLYDQAKEISTKQGIIQQPSTPKGSQEAA